MTLIGHIHFLQGILDNLNIRISSHYQLAIYFDDFHITMIKNATTKFAYCEVTLFTVNVDHIVGFI